MQEDIISRVWLFLEQLFENSEFFPVDIKMPSPTKIQVFIDGDNGIPIDQCAKVSRKLEAFLEENNIVGEKYTLEVSSPGMTNPLKVLRQYKRRIGSQLEVLKTDGIKFTGTLKAVDDQKIEIEEERKKSKKESEKILHTVSFEQIKHTKLVF